jgi:hypothetical protein
MEIKSATQVSLKHVLICTDNLDAPQMVPGSAEDVYIQDVERKMRLGFLSKVYSIIMIQTVITFGLAFFGIINFSIQIRIQFIASYFTAFGDVCSHPGVFWPMLALLITSMILAMCFSRRVPINYILLFTFVSA